MTKYDRGTKTLRDMTVAELRQYARENGMSSITRLTKKTELILAIERYQEQRAADERGELHRNRFAASSKSTACKCDRLGREACPVRGM